MIVTIVGAHGSIARLLTQRLHAQGHGVRGLVRREEQFDDLRSDGAEPVLCDLVNVDDDALDRALSASDVVVFAAGAGPDSTPEQTTALDGDGAVRAVHSAVRVGVDRFVIVSSMGADDPPEDDEPFSIYLRAKAHADAAVTSCELDHTVVRPGALTDDAGTGSVHIAGSTGRGEIPREDVAAVLARLIDADHGRNATFEVIGGETPVDEATKPLALLD